MAGTVARVGEKRGAYSDSVGKPQGKSHVEDQDKDGSMLLKLIFKKQMGGRRLD